MVITKAHAEALLQMKEDVEAGKAFTTIASIDEPTYLELETQGLARLEQPLKPVPTYWGTELARVLQSLVDEGKLAHPGTWREGWRWLGTEILAMMDAARRAGVVGPLAQEPLQERGLAEEVRDDKRKISYIQLSEAGETVLEMFDAIEPYFHITAELAEVIRKTPLGPAESARLTTPEHEEHLLEGMRLIAYSVPDSDIYAFTALGQAVKRALETGGFGVGSVMDEEILRLLADYVDGVEMAPEAVARLQELGYVGAEGELLPAGEWAMEAYRLLQEGARREVWSFAIEEEEAEVLEAVAHLWEKAKQNPEEAPTFKNLRRELLDRKIRQYRHLVERYGRRLDEMPYKHREIARAFMDAKSLEAWYDTHFELREALYSLESFQLLFSTVNEKGKEVFELTPLGEDVLADQQADRRDVTSTAVKTITMTRKTFSAPNYAWWKEAVEQRLVGSGEPTKSGLLYAHLAETLVRLPHLSLYELKVFHHIPEGGVSVDDVYRELEAEISRERIRWALEKLEARHLIDILPDGNIVETEAGMLMDRALAGVPEGFGNPVNPIIYRLLRALVDVGTLYVKERKVRILPRNWEEAIRRSGLAPDVFENAWEAARAARLVGQNSVNEGGLLLLEAVKKMNPVPGEIVSYATS